MDASREDGSPSADFDLEMYKALDEYEAEDTGEPVEDSGPATTGPLGTYHADDQDGIPINNKDDFLQALSGMPTASEVGAQLSNMMSPLSVKTKRPRGNPLAPYWTKEENELGLVEFKSIYQKEGYLFAPAQFLEDRDLVQEQANILEEAIAQNRPLDVMKISPASPYQALARAEFLLSQIDSPSLVMAFTDATNMLLRQLSNMEDMQGILQETMDLSIQSQETVLASRKELSLTIPKLEQSIESVKAELENMKEKGTKMVRGSSVPIVLQDKPLPSVLEKKEERKKLPLARNRLAQVGHIKETENTPMDQSTFVPLSRSGRKVDTS